MAKPKPAGITVTAVVDNHAPLAPVGAQPRRAAAKLARPRPTVSDVCSLPTCSLLEVECPADFTVASTTDGLGAGFYS